MRKNRTVITLSVAAAGVLALTGCRAAVPPTNPAVAADFTITQIATQNHAAFAATGNLVGNAASSDEILATSLNFGTPGPGGPPPIAGEVDMYTKSGTGWTQSVVVPTSEGIVNPNNLTIADVNKDGKNDFFLAAGYFFNRIGGPPTGSITWWENTGSGTFIRHDVVTGVTGSYHKAVFVDFDNDGKKDVVTTYEDGGFPAYPFAGPPVGPVTRVEFLKGDGAGNFAAPVKIADGGGATPVVFDINGDGKLDVASAQYFGVKTSPVTPPPPYFTPISNESAVWWEHTGPGTTQADFTKHVIASGLGESFSLIPVDNIDGNGRYGAILTVHTNPLTAPGSAPANVYRLTPGADVTQPWAVETVASGFVSPARPGQAAPGTTDSGDLDGDGDIDLSVDGDGDPGIYWIERKADGSWVKHNMATEFGVPGTDWGQGSTIIDDVDHNLKNEMIFTSYNANGVFIIERKAGTGGNFPASPHVPDSLLRY